MQFQTGTVFAYDELSSRMVDFGTKRLSNFTDAFSGGNGRSSYGGESNRSTICMTHKRTGVHFLFDFVPTFNVFETNEWEGENEEYAIVGTLVKGPLDIVVDDPTMSDFSVSDTLVESADTNSMTFSVPSGGEFTVTAGDADTWRPTGSTFEYVSDGDTIEFFDASSSLTYLFIVVSNDSGTVLTLSGDTAPPTDSDYRVRVTSSTGQAVTAANDVPFGQQLGTPWPTATFDTLKVSQGWFPNSRRLDFSTGIQFWFFGGDSSEEDYFHMVLKRPNGVYTHWWMGSVSNTDEIGQSSTNGVGAFLGTTGPFTDNIGTDHFQYIASLESAENVWQNPSMLSVAYTDTSTETDKIYMPDGGPHDYEPNGASVDPEYGPSSGHADAEDLDVDNFSIQIGLNGFKGNWAWKPANLYGGTETANSPRFDSSYFSINIAGDNRLIPFCPNVCFVTSIPFDSVASSRITAIEGGSPAILTSEYYAGKYAQYVHMGEFPAVYRGYGNIKSAQPETIKAGSEEFMSFPVVKLPALSPGTAEMYEETPGDGTNGSGHAMYIYRKS